MKKRENREKRRWKKGIVKKGEVIIIGEMEKIIGEVGSQKDGRYLGIEDLERKEDNVEEVLVDKMIIGNDEGRRGSEG